MASAVSEDPDDRQSLSTFRTMGGTLAGVVIGVGLPLIAYQKVDGVETLIGSRVTLAAGVFSVLVPALGFALLAAILWFWYPLHKKQVDENVIALKKKHASEA